MYRLFLIILLLVVLYFLLRQMCSGFRSPNRDIRGKSTDGTDRQEELDEMIEDPVCHTFVPKRIAVIEEMGAGVLFLQQRVCSGVSEPTPSVKDR